MTWCPWYGCHQSQGLSPVSLRINAMNMDIVSLAKHIGDALTARRPVHMPRMKMRELGLLLIELKAYREAAASIVH